MMHNLTLWLALGLAFALVSCVYAVILREPEMLLNAWHNWLDRMLGPGSASVAKNKRIAYLKAVGGDNLGTFEPRAYWLFKMLGGCPRCNAGQVALWGFPLVTLADGLKYAFFGHLVSTAASIFLVTFLQKAYNWSRK